MDCRDIFYCLQLLPFSVCSLQVSSKQSCHCWTLSLTTVALLCKCVLADGQVVGSHSTSMCFALSADTVSSVFWSDTVCSVLSSDTVCSVFWSDTYKGNKTSDQTVRTHVHANQPKVGWEFPHTIMQCLLYRRELPRSVVIMEFKRFSPWSCTYVCCLASGRGGGDYHNCKFHNYDLIRGLL